MIDIKLSYIQEIALAVALVLIGILLFNLSMRRSLGRDLKKSFNGRINKLYAEEEILAQIAWEKEQARKKKEAGLSFRQLAVLRAHQAKIEQDKLKESQKKKKSSINITE